MTVYFSRRDFIRTGTLATGATFFSPRLLEGFGPQADYYREPLEHQRPGQASQEVLVLGAGLAGLEASRQLAKAGHEVRVLEARRRPGGRVHTLRDEFPGELYAEVGARFLGGPHMRDLVKELDLSLTAPVEQKGLDALALLRGERVRVSESGPDRPWPVELTEEERNLGLEGIQERYYLSVAEDIGDPAAEGWPPERLRKYDEMSFAEFLREQGASEGALTLFSLAGLGTFHDRSMETTSALFHLWKAALDIHHPTPDWTGGVVPGGNAQLPEAMAAQVDDRIQYGAAVVAIERSEARVRVVVRRQGTGHQETVQADRVVCALPFSVLRFIDLSPSFPADKREAIEGMQYGAHTLAFLQVRRRFWEDRGLSGAAATDFSPSGVGVQPSARQTRRAILEAGTDGETAFQLAGLDDDELLALMASKVEKIHPGLFDYLEGGTTFAWSDDPWMRGGMSSYWPGDMMEFFSVVGRTEGRIHFAGEHTSPFSNADAAVASGRRAAREVDEAAKQAAT